MEGFVSGETLWDYVAHHVAVMSHGAAKDPKKCLGINGNCSQS